MEWREGKSTKYLYQKDGDVLLVSYVDKKKKKMLSVLWKMSERNLVFIRFMITQKGCWCGWSYIFSSIYLLQISPMTGECPSIFCLTLFEQIQKFYSPNIQNLMLCQHLNLLFVLENSLLFQPYSIALKILAVSKVLPCRKLKEYFAPKISIVLSEM